MKVSTLSDQIPARFINGVGNSIDHLTAKNNFDRANIRYISGKYDFVLRRDVYRYYQGIFGN